jgi:hypothetical protein
MNDQTSTEYREMDSVKPRQPSGKSSWSITASCCGYFLLGGWAAFKLVPIYFTSFAGLGFTISLNSTLFHLLNNYVWLIVPGAAGLVTLVLAKQFVNFNERFRRLVNFFLVIVAIALAPMLVAAIVLELAGPFHLVGKLA